MANPNPSFREDTATAVSEYLKVLQDTFVEDHALLSHLSEAGFVEEHEPSRSIVSPLLHERGNNTFKSLTGDDLLTITPSAGPSAVEYFWKYYAGTISYNEEEEWKNSGPGQRVRLLEAKMTLFDLNVKQEMQSALHGDGTGNGGKDLLGLGILVESGAGGAWSSVGGIDSSTNTFWRNVWQDASGTNFTDATGNSLNGIRRIRQAVRDTAKGADKTTLLYSGWTHFNTFREYLESKTRILESSQEMAKFGFMSVMLDNIPWVVDEDYSSSDILGLNRNYLKLYVGQGRNFAKSDWVESSNQLTHVMKVRFNGVFMTTNRNRHFRIEGMS